MTTNFHDEQSAIACQDLREAIEAIFTATGPCESTFAAMRAVIPALRRHGDYVIWRDKEIAGQRTVVVLDPAEDHDLLVHQPVTSLERWKSVPSSLTRGEAPLGTFQLQLIASAHSPVTADVLARWWTWLLRIADAAGAAGYNAKQTPNIIRFERRQHAVLTEAERARARGSQAWHRAQWAAHPGHVRSPEDLIDEDCDLRAVAGELEELHRQGARQLTLVRSVSSPIMFSVCATDPDSGRRTPVSGAAARLLVHYTASGTVELRADGVQITAMPWVSKVISDDRFFDRFRWELPAETPPAERLLTGSVFSRVRDRLQK